jgi:hypothetical protein
MLIFPGNHRFKERVCSAIGETKEASLPLVPFTLVAYHPTTPILYEQEDRMLLVS